MTEKFIHIKDLNFSYNNRTVLHDINLDINKSEFVGIIGPNGVGKSTLIKLIAGLLQADNGDILINRQKIQNYQRKALARITGYVPQTVDISFTFSVQEIVSMGRYPHLEGLMQNDIHATANIAQAMNWMELNTLKERQFSTLSGGEKQRTIIASALAQQADILLLDEPTSALDLKHQVQIGQILKRLSVEEGKTIVLVTHDVNLAAQFCTKLFLMHEGRIIARGKPDEVLRFPIIQEVYGVKVYIDINPFTKSLYILPYETR